MKLAAIHHSGLLVEGAPRPNEVLPDVGVVGLDEPLVERLRDLVDQHLRLEVDGGPAVPTEGLVLRGLLVAARAGDRRDLLGLAILDDVEAVHRRVLLLLSLPGELRDVSRDDRRAAGSALPVLDERLGLLARGQPVGVALAEVRRRDGFSDASAIGRLLEALEEALVAEPFGGVQFRPEEVFALAGVVGEPLLDVRGREDEVDVVLATLPIDADLQRVLPVGEVLAAHVVELTSTEPALELQCDQGPVPGVACRLDHGLDVLLEVEHVRLVGLGLVVAGGLRRDPLVCVGDLVAPSGVLREQAEGYPVVAVGFLGAVLDVVGVVDPADDLLRGVLRRVEGLLGLGGALAFDHEGLVEAGVSFLADADVVPEELFVAVVSVVFPTDLQLVTELHEEFAVTVAPATLGGVESAPEGVDGLLRTASHIIALYPSDGKGSVESPPPASTNPFTFLPTTEDRPVGGFSVGPGDTPHVDLTSAQGVVA